MNQLTCPNCGAPMGYSNQCEYCGAGAPASSYYAEWIVESERLPEPSATDPHRSDYVLGVFYIEAIMPGVGDNPINFYGSIISLYYDFKHKKWINELLPSRFRETLITHWMPQPPADSPLWLSIAERGLPEADPAQDGDKSIYVLVHLTDQPYEKGIFSASVSLSKGYWSTGNLFSLLNGSYQIERWMMIPAVLHPATE